MNAKIKTELEKIYTVEDAETGNWQIHQSSNYDEAVKYANDDEDIDTIPLTVSCNGQAIYHTTHGQL